MDKIIIKGGQSLKGCVEVSGAKNSALPILAATLLTDEVCRIENVSNLKDVRTMVEILSLLGVKVDFKDGIVSVDASDFKGHQAPYELVKTMRASICILGPLLARKKIASVSLPGGCIIGSRPIDLHLRGLRLLGADIEVKHGYINAKTQKLKGSRIYLGGPFGSSVLATANLLMAATLAEGDTYIESAACEPEIADLADFLNKMGARISGAGTPIIKIEGVERLKGVNHTVIPDRIEAGTYLAAGAITRGDVLVKNARVNDLGAVLDVLKNTGSTLSFESNGIRIKGPDKILPADITTLPYPGFPTDMQAQLMSLLSIGVGISIITEKVFPERFIQVGELNRMGAAITLERSTAIIRGVEYLSGTEVMASDLRASAGLVIAGLIAEGETTISRVYHLDRGYENMVEKLQNLGAEIKRVKDD